MGIRALSRSQHSSRDYQVLSGDRANSTQRPQISVLKPASSNPGAFDNPERQAPAPRCSRGLVGFRRDPPSINMQHERKIHEEDWPHTSASRIDRKRCHGRSQTHDGQGGSGRGFDNCFNGNEKT
jgi:hypothetical protein